MVAGNKNGSIQVFDYSTGKEEKYVKEFLLPIRSVAHSGSRLAVGCEDKHVGLFDCETFKNTALLVNHVEEVTQVRFIDDNKLLSASFDGTVKLWDLNTNKAVKKLKIGSPVIDLSYSNDRIAVAAEDAVHLIKL